MQRGPLQLLRRLAPVVRWWIRLPVVLRYSLPPLLMIGLWWSSSRQPGGGEVSAVRAFLHNGAHVLAYGALAAAWWTALLGLVPARRLPLAAFVLAVAYGVVDELHQACVPGRACSLGDLVSDGAGSWLATLVLRWVVHGDEQAASRIPLAACLAVLAVFFATFVPV